MTPLKVCNFLTALKHKNTIIHLQIFRKLSSHTCFSEKQCYSQLFNFENSVHSVLKCMFLFWSVWFLPLTAYPIIFRQSRLPVGGKKHCNAAMETSKRTGSKIAHFTWSKKNKQRHPTKKLDDQRHMKIWTNQLINILNFGLHYPFQQLAVNRRVRL